MANADEWRPKVNPWLIAFTMVLPAFMVVLDTSVANVALPHIAGSLSAGADEATWILTCYLVANVIVLPISGWLTQVIGRRRLLIIGMILFTVSSFGCGAAISLDMAIIFRIIQGASGGALLPNVQAILLEASPAQKGGRPWRHTPSVSSLPP